jgi:hypothetical protein
MANVQRVGDLEVEEDLDFQRREWTAERVAWVVMGLLLLAALLGVFGRGPLSNATAEEGSLRVGYARFERKGAPTEVRVEIAAGTAHQGQVHLWLDRDYAMGVEIRQIAPEPEQAQTGGDRVLYVFQVNDPSQPVDVIVRLEHDDWGVKTGRIGLVNGPELELRQIVYP